MVKLPRIPRAILRPLQLFVAVLLVYGAYVLALQATGNVHTSIPGELYRSAQPTAADLRQDVQRYGIRTVINLRGSNGGFPWYKEELDASHDLNLTHLDFRMKASKELTPEQAQQLIAMMRDAPKPILLHCQQGSDRTGLAAALYVAAIAHGSEQEASDQLSLRYGHIPFSFGKGYAMTQSFDHLKPMLGY